ncbi:MAG: hypothetical protein MZV70_13025, partial [Desulfobacterales bacterium]|nr:hypothetical protein [Desulfobacterales bacterium]
YASFSYVLLRLNRRLQTESTAPPSDRYSSERTLRADTDAQLDGLKRSRETIKRRRNRLPADQPCRAIRLRRADRWAPSAVETFGRMPEN